MILRDFFNGHDELLDYISWIIRSLEPFFKNSFVSPCPQMPTCSHERCLPPRVDNSIPSFTEVFKNPFPAINKGKEISYKI